MSPDPRVTTLGVAIASAVVATATILCSATQSSPAPAPPESRPSQPKPIRDFAPGVRIDWSSKTVLVDAEVILRTGPLELFACSRGTREHESIVVVPARPMHVYQALGLIGLQPGKALHFDERGQEWVPPSGGLLDIQVRYRLGEEERTVAVADWLEAVATKRPPEKKVEWVFAGSLTLAGGRFAADVEGTVIGLVDFEAALIAVRGLHTADNELLWLRANTAAIPPVGTRCTILIRSGDAAPAPVPPGVEDKPGSADNASPDGRNPPER